MTWTTEKPTVPGYYWYRIQGNDDQIVEVVFSKRDGCFEVYWMADNGGWPLQFTNGAEWAGPIKPPQG